MNTPLEVMKAIVDNGGPIEAWVRRKGWDWEKAHVIGVVIRDRYPFHESDFRWEECSLTDPTAKSRPMPPPDKGEGMTNKEIAERLREIGHFGGWDDLGKFIDELDPAAKTRPMTRMEILGVLTREGCIVRTKRDGGWCYSQAFTVAAINADYEYAIINRKGGIIEGPSRFEVTE